MNWGVIGNIGVFRACEAKYRVMTSMDTRNDYHDSKPINGGSTWGLIKLHLWCLSPRFWALFQEKQWQPLMSNWPLLFVSLSFTFHICLWCGPWWQQTALLSILNFCAELQHLSLGSCVMVSIWKFFILNSYSLFLPTGEFYPNSPHSTPTHSFSDLWLTTVPHFQTFFLNWMVCLWNIDIIYPWEQEERYSVVERFWFCLKSDMIPDKLFTSLSFYIKIGYQ